MNTLVADLRAHLTKSRLTKVDFCIGLFVAVTIFGYRLPKFLEKSFGELSLEQLLFHLGTEVDGTPVSFVWSTVKYLLFKPLLWGALAILILSFVKNALRRIVISALLVSGFAAITAGTLHLYRVLHLGDYFSATADIGPAQQVNWMNDWYTAPVVTTKAVSKHLNLIHIYVESLEASRVPSNSVLRIQNGKSFVAQEFMVLPGTQWTLAGMVATQCGVPLLPVGLHGGNRFDEVAAPLKNAECIGDILQQHGYRGEFIGGADEEFSGKSNYLSEHGYGTIWGRAALDEVYSDDGYPADWWGHPDNTVLDFARKRVTELARSSDPYFLTVLTLDTHGPGGMLTPYCRNKGYDKSQESIFACSVAQVEEFVAWLRKEKHLENTVVVVSGDHPFMSPQSDTSIRQSKQQALAYRDVFFSINAPHALPKSGDTMNHFDALPTVLAALGFEVQDNRAALGRNLLATESLSKQRTQNAISVSLRKKSESYISLWQ